MIIQNINKRSLIYLRLHPTIFIKLFFIFTILEKVSTLSCNDSKFILSRHKLPSLPILNAQCRSFYCDSVCLSSLCISSPVFSLAIAFERMVGCQRIVLHRWDSGLQHFHQHPGKRCTLRLAFIEHYIMELTISLLLYDPSLTFVIYIPS